MSTAPGTAARTIAPPPPQQQTGPQQTRARGVPACRIYPHAHATPLGAAALARCALEPALSLKEAVGDWQPTTVYEPRWSTDRAEEFRTTWAKAATACATEGDHS